METRTHKGVTYQRSGPGEPWQRVGAPAGGRIIPKSETVQRKEGADADKSVVDAQTGAAELPYVAPTAAANINKTVTDTAVTQQNLDDAVLKAMRGGVEGETRTKALDAYNAAPALEKLADEIEKAYRSGVGKTSGITGIKDFLPTGENRAFGLIGGRARGTFKQALGFTGGEGNTAGELTINYGPYIPTQYDTNEEVERKISNIRTLAYDARKKSISYLGGVPDAAGNVARLPEGLTREQAEKLYGGATVDEAVKPAAPPPKPATEVRGDGAMVNDPALAGANSVVNRMLREGRSESDIRAFLNGIRPGLGDGANGISENIEYLRKNPSYNPSVDLEQVWEPATGVDAAVGWLADSPLGAGAISAANAVTAGNLGNLAGGDATVIMEGLRQQRPGATFAGDILGSGVAMANITNAAPRLGFGLLGRAGGLGADSLYGGVRGFSEGDGIGDGLLGAGAAALGNLGGQYLLSPAARALTDTNVGRAVVDGAANSGRAVGNAWRGVRGQAPRAYDGANIPTTTLGQRVIANNLPDDVDPIAAALTAGRDIGMPMTLADVSPRLRNMGGAAFRRADLDTQEEIARLLTDRARGQAGRAQNQIEAAFGPLDDPLQASQSLMATARNQSRPLYEAFRAQPARTSPELQAMMATPAGQRALVNARTMAANEGRDPNAMGFDLDELGQVVLRSDPSPETIDLVKRGLDDVLEGYRDPTSGRLNLDEGGRAIEALRQRYVAEADRLYPDTYAAARAAYAGPAADNSALQAGQAMVGRHPRQVGQRMSGMTDTQLDQFRLGQRSAMGDTVQSARTSSDPYQRIWGDPLDMERASMVFGPEAAARFNQAYDAEQAMSATRNAFIGGSPTQGRQALDEQLSSGIGGELTRGLLETSISGSPVMTGLGMAQRYLRNREGLGFQGAREDASSEIARLLASERPTEEISRLLSDAAAYRRYVDDSRSRFGGYGAALATGATSFGY